MDNNNTILLSKIRDAIGSLMSDMMDKLTTIKNNLNDMIVVKTASGSIATFETDIEKPLISCNIEILPKQASGTPTPSNPLPISGTDTITVTQTGKNLFNTSNVLDAYLNTMGVIKSSINTKLIYAKCNPNTTYTVSKTAGQRFQVAYCDSLPIIDLQCGGMISDGTASSITITTNATAKYIVAYVYHESYDTITVEQMLASIQIERGSTATTYEPYTATTKTVSLPETVYGGEVDVIGGDVIITHDAEDLGNLTWYYESDEGYFYSDSITTIKDNDNNAVCTSGYTYDATLSADKTFTIVNKQIRFRDDTYSAAPDFKTAVTGIDFMYELAEAQSDTLTPISITALNGVNNIFSDSGNTAVQYLKKYQED